MVSQYLTNSSLALTKTSLPNEIPYLGISNGLEPIERLRASVEKANVVVTKIGFKEQVLTITVANGETTNLKVELEKV